MVNFGNKVETITNGMGEKLSKSIKTLFEKLVGMNITPMGLATSFVTGSRDYYKKFWNISPVGFVRNTSSLPFIGCKKPSS